MRIAILLPGHIRYWNFCKKNFLETLYDTNHQIDVFIDTYYQIFSSDSNKEHEASLYFEETEENIRKLFDDINVVSFKIENQEYEFNHDVYQMRKLMKIANDCIEYQKANNFTYDLVVRSRFDIFIEDVINYNSIKSQIAPNEVFIPRIGPPIRGLNDMLAIMNADSILKYVDRSEPAFNNGLNGLSFRLIYTIAIARMGNHNQINLIKG